jgi:hypothetical protein
MGGKASGAKEGVFFSVFLSSVLPPWIHHHHQDIGEKRCYERAAQAVAVHPSPFATIRGFFSPVLTNACITFASRSGVVDIRSLFFYTEEKEADEKGKVAATAPIYT